MLNKVKAALLSVASLAALGAVGAEAQTYAITNARLMVAGDIESPGTIRNGTVVFRNGRITNVGADLRAPAGADVFDAGGSYVTPGIFAPLSAIGLDEIGNAREPNDRNAGGRVAHSISLMAADGLYPDATAIPHNRAGGITRAFTTIDPGASIIGGCGAVISFSGKPDPVIHKCGAHLVALGYAGARKEGDSRPAAMAAFRRALDDAKLYREDSFSYRRNKEPGQLLEADAKALVPVLNGERRLLVEVNGAADIIRVLDVAAEYDLDIVLVGAAEAHRVAADIAAADVPVIINPFLNLPTSLETFGATQEAPALLEKAGVEVTFFDDDNYYSHTLRAIPQLAGNAVAFGMSHEGAVEAITLTPAKVHGIEDRYGSLSIGKVADVVIWDGDPLEVTTRPRMVFIDGVAQSLDDRQSALAARYRNPGEGDMPHAYRGE